MRGPGLETRDTDAIHPRGPLLAATRFQAAAKVRGAVTLSIRLYHVPPVTPLSRAANIRSVQIDASTQAHDCGAWFLLQV